MKGAFALEDAWFQTNDIDTAYMNASTYFGYNDQMQLAILAERQISKQNPHLKSRALVALAQIMVNQRNYESALGLVNELDPRHRDSSGQIFQIVGNAYRNNGDMERAFQLACDNVDCWRNYGSVFLKGSKVRYFDFFVEKDDLDRAFKVAFDMPLYSGVPWKEVCPDLIEGFLYHREFDLAIHLAELLQSCPWKETRILGDHALHTIAIALAENEQPVRAEEIANTIEDVETKQAALDELAQLKDA